MSDDEFIYRLAYYSSVTIGLVGEVLIFTTLAKSYFLGSEVNFTEMLIKLISVAVSVAFAFYVKSVLSQTK